MMFEYRSTFGRAEYADDGFTLLFVDDPDPPDGEGWELVSTCLGEMRYSVCALIWSWQRPKP